MEKLLAMVGAVVLLTPLTIIVSTLVGGVFVYFGWNGCHVLLGVREITFGEAFWLCMLSRSILSVANVSGGK